MNESASAAAIIAAALPIIGIAFSTWSFNFSEEGATPDEFYDPSPPLNFDEEILEREARRSARLCARLTFRLGALCLAAAVPMGMADSHALGLVSLPASAAYVMLIFGLIYGVVASSNIWTARHECVFDAYYSGNKLWFLYPNKKAIRSLFFSMNHLPFWAVFKRSWFQREFETPSAEQLIATNAESSVPQA